MIRLDDDKANICFVLSVIALMAGSSLATFCSFIEGLSLHPRFSFFPLPQFKNHAPILKSLFSHPSSIMLFIPITVSITVIQHTLDNDQQQYEIYST